VHVRVKHRLAAAVVLNLLLPGSGHLFLGEMLFGLFVFLVMLIAAGLFFVSFLISLPTGVKWVMLGLPLLFYAFSFVDLSNTVRTRRKLLQRTRRALIGFLALGLVYQILSPYAPVNFIINNLPQVYKQKDMRLAPLFRQGDLLKVNSLSYFVHVVMVKRPILHNLPERYDVLRFRSAGDIRRTGVVVGLPNEQVEINDGEVVANGVPQTGGVPGLKLSGSWPSMTAKEYSILVATFSLGSIDHVYQVPLGDVIGKVSRLF
jgi:hypothetical protein